MSIGSSANSPATSDSTAAGSARSTARQVTISAPTLALMSPAVANRTSSRLPTMTTSSPSRANRCAGARPIPVPPPVTTTRHVISPPVRWLDGLRWPSPSSLAEDRSAQWRRWRGKARNRPGPGLWVLEHTRFVAAGAQVRSCARKYGPELDVRVAESFMCVEVTLDSAVGCAQSFMCASIRLPRPACDKGRATPSSRPTFVLAIRPAL